MFRLYIVLLICFLFAIQANAQMPFEEEKSSLLDTAIVKLFYTPEDVRNQVTLDFYYGISAPTYSRAILDEKFARTFLLEIKYGFSRIRPIVDIRRFYYSSEFAFISNISSDLKPKSWIKVGIPSDLWRFGFGYRNGYGYNLDNNTNLLLYHSSAITWSHLDLYTNPQNDPNLQPLKQFYNEFKFGSMHEAGIQYQIYKPVFLHFSYDNSYIYPVFLPWKWIGSGMIELTLQRGVDALAHFMIDKEPDLVPVSHFIIKNGISLILNQLRRTNAHFPFDSPAPLYNGHIKLGISFIF